jgi:hypothetical protein
MAYCRRNQPSLRARSPATRRTHTCVYIAASLFGGSSVRAPWTPLASAVRCEFRAVIMDAALRGISTDAVVLAPGISAKLITAAEAEGDHVIPTSRATVVGKQFKVLATLAGLTMSELNALCTWLEEAYSPEAAERFEHDLKMMTPATLPSPAASGTGGAPAAADAAAAKALAEAEASADSAAAKFAALKLSATGFAPMPKLLSTSTASGITANEAADNAAHGFTEAGMIALLTWTFMCARIPNMASDDVKYGVAPDGTKLYKTYKGGHTSMLYDLVHKATTTLPDLRDHMHAAVSAARDYPPVAKRLADHWLEMQRYFANSARLMIRYYQKFLLNMRGRGLPDLIDRDLVLLVLCESTGNPGGDEEHAKQMKEMAEKLDKMKSLVDSLKETVSDLKGSVGSLKNEVKEAKGNSKWCSWCAAKGFKASGHLEKDCDKKKEAAKKGED